MPQKSLFSRNIITKEDDENNSHDADSETDFAVSEKINLKAASKSCHKLLLDTPIKFGLKDDN